MVKVSIVIAALASACALFAQAPAPAAADPNKVVLTVGDQKFTAAQFEGILKTLPAQYQQQLATPQGKRAFAENLVQLRVLAVEAVKQGVDKKPEVQQQIEFSRQDMLARAMFDTLQAQAKVDDAAVKEYYEAHKQDYESVRARHILVRVKGAPMPQPEGKPELDDDAAKAKANEIRKKIVGGADFAAVAKTDSDDTGSGAQGGDLGEFKRGMMVPPFEQAAFTLKPGDVSEPVKSPFGYHIIQVQQHTSKTLEEAKPEIQKNLGPEIARKQLDSLVGKTDVKYDDVYFGGAPPAPKQK